MKVNKLLLPIKLHYFFLFAGVGPLLPFLPVYANLNLGISYIGIGLIYTVLPILGLLSKAFSGMLSDCLNAHRAMFLSSLLICALGFFCIYFTRPMPTTQNPDPAHLQLDCSTTSYLRYSISEKKCGTSEFIDGNHNSSVVAVCEVDCPTSDAIIEELCKDWKLGPECQKVLLKFTAYTALSHSIQLEHDTFFPIYNISYFGTGIDHPTCKKQVKLNCSALCDDSKLMDFLGAPLQILLSTYQEILGHYQFWSYFLCIIFGWCGLGILVVMSDTVCFQLLETEGSNYGKQRMFGSMGWGLSALFTGFLIDLTSDGLVKKDYTSAFMLSLSLLAMDFFVGTRLKFRNEKRGETRSTSIIQLFCNPQISIFVLCCIVVGFSTSILWTFQLILVEKVAYEWNCQFEHLKLLQGLMMCIQCFAGEIPSFFFSGLLIEKLGHLFCMSLAIAMFGVRFILYYFVVNPWLFLPIELLNGITFGVFYATMASYASIIAPQGAQATIQGIFGASFEGLGMAIGGLAGGALFSTVGEAETFLYIGIMNLLYALLYTIIHTIISRLKPTYQLANTGPAEEPIQVNLCLNHLTEYEEIR